MISTRDASCDLEVNNASFKPFKRISRFIIIFKTVSETGGEMAISARERLTALYAPQSHRAYQHERVQPHDTVAELISTIFDMDGCI